MANKVKFGLKNVHYAIATIAADGSATYATPVAWPGAVNMQMEPSGENANFNADDIVYYTANGATGYTGSLESALVPQSFREDVLGETEDTKGVLIESLGAPTVHFALLFQFDGDESPTKHVLYNCTATRPSVSSTTKGESVEVQTETVNLTATSVYNATLQANVVKAKTGDSVDSTVYDGWFTTVYQSA